jgi:hypothetical protein
LSVISLIGKILTEMNTQRTREGVVFGLALVMLVVFLLVPVHSRAAINRQINFQGKLTNPDGTNITDGNYSIRYRIYTSSSLDGANPCAANSCKWEETQSVAVADGIFQVSLGSSTALPGSVDFNSSPLYLGVKVGSDAEMTPRIQFTAAPYAFNSDSVDGIDSAGLVQLGQNSSAQTDSSTNSAIFINKTNTGNQIQLQASAVDVFTITNSGSITLGQNAAKTISVAQTSTNAAGQSLTISAGQGGVGAGANAGGNLTVQAGAGGGTNGNGGNLILSGGALNGSGLVGSVVVKNPTDSTTAFQVQNAAGTTAVLSADTVNGIVTVTGGLVVNTNDNSIVRTSSTDFSLGTVGSDISNNNGQMELSDGTIPNSGTGTISTAASQPAVDAIIGAGASAITSSNDKCLGVRKRTGYRIIK